MELVPGKPSGPRQLAVRKLEVIKDRERKTNILIFMG